jgi:hypothetical protein
MEQGSIGIFENVDERGALQIRSLIGKYGLKSLLEAVRVEIHETLSSHTYGDKIRDDPEDADLQTTGRAGSAGAPSSSFDGPRHWIPPAGYSVSKPSRASLKLCLILARPVFFLLCAFQLAKYVSRCSSSDSVFG